MKRIIKSSRFFGTNHTLAEATLPPKPPAVQNPPIDDKKDAPKIEESPKPAAAPDSAIKTTVYPEDDPNIYPGYW